MVKIIDSSKRTSLDGKEFVVLVLQGKIETAISKETGRPYLTARKTAIPCTFDEVTANSLIGQTLPGEIERMECEKYEFTVPDTGEKLNLTHTFRYNPTPETVEEVVG